MAAGHTAEELTNNCNMNCNNNSNNNDTCNNIPILVHDDTIAEQCAQQW